MQNSARDHEGQENLGVSQFSAGLNPIGNARLTEVPSDESAQTNDETDRILPDERNMNLRLSANARKKHEETSSSEISVPMGLRSRQQSFE